MSFTGSRIAQPLHHQPPQRFGPTRPIRLRLPPGIEEGELLRLKARADELT
jgi:hypothetical protein